MQIFVQGLQVYTFTIEGPETANDIKALVQEREEVGDEEEILVLYEGQPLEEDVLLSSLPALSTVSVQIRLLGGKVHGSLARAGKVKGQTPKVEPQEKKKKKTGRAKRRQQYNRRFSNTVTTPGRQKGPNAQS